MAKRRLLTTEANVVGGVKKLSMSFLTPPYRKVQSPSPLFSLFYSPHKQDVVILWHPCRLHKEQRPSRRQHLGLVSGRCHCCAGRLGKTLHAVNKRVRHSPPSEYPDRNPNYTIRAQNPPGCRTFLTCRRQLVTGGLNIFPSNCPNSTGN